MYAEHTLWIPSHIIQNPNIKHVVIDIGYMFNKMVRSVINEQVDIFGKDFSKGMHTRFKVIFLNNYFICVDTLFRMIAHCHKFINTLKERFNVNKFYFVNSTKPDIPPWRYVYCEGLSGLYPLNELYAYREAARRLYHLAKCMTEDEVEEYVPYERFIANKYPSVFYRTLHTRIVDYTYSREEKKKYKVSFFGIMQVIQSQITSHEWEYIFKYVLRTVNRWKGVRVLSEVSTLVEHYGAAEYAVSLGNAIIFSKYIIRTRGIFEYNTTNKEAYETTVAKKAPPRFANKPEIKQMRFGKKEQYTLSYMFDLCSREMENKMLSTDIYNIYNIFIKPEILYIKNKRPKKYEDFGDNFTDIPLDKQMCIDVLKDFVEKYNQLFQTDIEIIHIVT